MNPYRILPVGEELLPPAGEIHSESWRASHGFCSPAFLAAHTPEAQTEYLRRELSAGKRLFLLTDGLPVGIVSVHGDMIENLYVRPALQGRGYGTALLEFACGECDGTPELWVLSVNETARRFYEHRGFRATGARKELKGGMYELQMTRSR